MVGTLSMPPGLFRFDPCFLVNGNDRDMNFGAQMRSSIVGRDVAATHQCPSSSRSHSRSSCYFCFLNLTQRCLTQ
jgi:hypothetical protein